MYYNSNCENQETQQKYCFKVVHEICCYPTYFNETHCNHENLNFSNEENFFNYNQILNKNYNNCNCNNHKEKDYECNYNNKKTHSRCCCFRRCC